MITILSFDNMYFIRFAAFVKTRNSHALMNAKWRPVSACVFTITMITLITRFFHVSIENHGRMTIHLHPVFCFVNHLIYYSVSLYIFWKLYRRTIYKKFSTTVGGGDTGNWLQNEISYFACSLCGIIIQLILNDISCFIFMASFKMLREISLYNLFQWIRDSHIFFLKLQVQYVLVT